MKCHSCGCDNREGAKFCGECAAPLAVALACPSCGTANPKGRKFCDSCGQPLAEPSAPDPRSYTPKHLAEKVLLKRQYSEGSRISLHKRECHGKQWLRHHHCRRRLGRRGSGQSHVRARGAGAGTGARETLQGPNPWGVLGSVGRRGNTGAWHL